MKPYRCFCSNADAVLGLPMRLTVGLIIGTVALAAILSFVLNPCLFPAKMVVSCEPMIQHITGDVPVSLTEDIVFTITTSDGHPVVDALLIIRGLGDVGSGTSDGTGMVTITGTDFTVQLVAGTYEGYLDVTVKAPCFETFDQPDMIKVVKTTAAP